LQPILRKAGHHCPASLFPDRDETAETGTFGPILATIPDHSLFDSEKPWYPLAT
jgi:hypothetical protein